MRESTIENQINIDLITLNNAEDVLKLYPEVGQEKLAKIKKDVSDDIEKAKKGERIIFGAKNGAEIIGTVQLIFKGDKDFYADGKLRAHIHHARVAGHARSKGIGSKLMQQAEIEARNRGFREMTLGVEETNKSAIRFYMQLGYREFMREKDDEGEIIIGMKKEL